jgi:hypothetical protein
MGSVSLSFNCMFKLEREMVLVFGSFFLLFGIFCLDVLPCPRIRLMMGLGLGRIGFLAWAWAFSKYMMEKRGAIVQC